MLRQEKVESVAGLKQLFEDAGAFFITDYQGLNVADMTVLRKNLRENNVKFLVAKNTLFRLAAKDAGVEGVDEHFNGPTAIAFAMDDPSMAAKILLLSQLVAAVESPLSELVGSLDGFFRDLVGSIDALADKVKAEA